MYQQQPVVMQMPQHPGMVQMQPQYAQQQPQYVQQQPQYVQQQPQYVQQPAQPVYVQQQPQYVQQPQPVYVQQQQPVMVQQPMVVQQPIIVQQPMMQPAVVFPSQNGGMGNNNTMNGPQNPQEIQRIMEEFKKANAIRIKYLEPNFRGEGGCKFALYLRGSSDQIASGFTNKHGLITIETNESENAFTLAGVTNNSATMYNVNNGAKDLIGTVTLETSSCNSWSINAEKSGSRSLALQNPQWSWLLCFCCSVIYTLYFKLCTNGNTLRLVDGEGEVVGEGQYLTDEMNSFREVEINMNGGPNVEARIFAALLGLVYMDKKVGESIKAKNGDLEANPDF